MAKFVVTLQLPDYFDEEFMALIPTHRALINQLIEEHIVESYAISVNRSRGWITINAQSSEAVQAVVAQLPLYRFFVRFEIDELFLFDSASSRFPQLSLN